MFTDRCLSAQPCYVEGGFARNMRVFANDGHGIPLKSHHPLSPKTNSARLTSTLRSEHMKEET